MSGAQLEKDVQFAPHLRENGGIAGREKGLPHPHKAAAQTASNNGSDQIAQGIAQLPPNLPAKRSAAQVPRSKPLLEPIDQRTNGFFTMDVVEQFVEKILETLGMDDPNGGPLSETTATFRVDHSVATCV